MTGMEIAGIGMQGVGAGIQGYFANEQANRDRKWDKEKQRQNMAEQKRQANMQFFLQKREQNQTESMQQIDKAKGFSELEVMRRQKNQQAALLKAFITAVPSKGAGQ